MVSYVIVPLDGSSLAEQALPLAASLVQQAMASADSATWDSVLQLVQVVPSPIQSDSLVSPPEGNMSPVGVVESYQTTAQSYLSKIEAQLAETGVPLETSVIEMCETDPRCADIGSALASFANKQHKCVIVMSTHGHTGLSRWRLGSVADQVLHLSEHPLIIMRPQDESPNMPTREDKLPQLKRIVVPLDGSFFAEQVLPHAKKLAHAHSAELLLFRSVSAVSPGMIGADVAVLDTRLYDMNRQEAKDYLKRIKVNLEVEGFKVRIEVGGMPTADAILRIAAKVNADLIAMATHARGAIARLIWGSVTDRVVRAGEIPVLVTRAETKES
jgi:nucleotide-binding universal stress UspA family protein